MMKSNQFKINEAWIAFMLNDDPISLQEGEHNIYVLMDAGSTFVIGQVPAKITMSPAIEDIEALFEEAFKEKQEWPSRLIITDNIINDNNFKIVAESKNISIDRIAESQLLDIIGPLKKQFYDSWQDTININHDVSIEAYEVTEDMLKKANVDISTGELTEDGSDRLGKVFLSDYYTKWLDNSIPGLDGMTPRKASKSKEGILLLNKLFEHMKSLNVPEDLRPDINALRKELGL